MSKSPRFSSKQAAPLYNNRPLLQPHERDEIPDQHPIKIDKKIKQAATDLKKGLVDTDLHGMRGVEKTVKHNKS